MGLRIRSNIPSESVQRNLKKISKRVDKTFNQLSSGKRITMSADDAAGMAIATNLRAQTKALGQAVRNANDGITLVQTAEGGLSEVTNILVRLRELSVQAASDTNGDKERGLLNQEYQQLLSEVDRISESTTFNGTNLLNGKSGRGTLDFHVGAFGGDHNRIRFNADASNSTTSNIGVGSLNVSSREEAVDAIDKVDEAINKVSGFRASLGAVQSRLQSTVQNLEIQKLNQENARSTIEDVDVAEVTAKMASNNILKSAGIATLAQANMIPNQAIRLIQ